MTRILCLQLFRREDHSRQEKKRNAKLEHARQKNRLPIPWKDFLQGLGLLNSNAHRLDDIKTTFAGCKSSPKK